MGKIIKNGVEYSYSPTETEIGDLFITRDFDSAVFSVAANASYSGSINIKVAGYKPIGVLKVQTNHGFSIRSDNWWIVENTFKFYVVSTTAYSDAKLLTTIAYAPVSEDANT